ncbi:MAG TPA: cytochrome c [Thermoanaerobaculia bacterium]|nr:cytochrome c [Thermoanaerobaculia bacterium]
MRKIMAVAALTAFVLMPVAANAADGAALYKAKCASCHGVDGKGETAMGKKMQLRDLGSEDVQKQTDEKLIEITADGAGKMPAYKGKLSAEEIKSLIQHIRSFKK